MRRIFCICLLTAASGWAQDSPDKPEPPRITVNARLPTMRVQVPPANGCAIPLLPVTPPGSKDFKIRQSTPDLKKVAPMPQYNGLPACPVAPKQ